MRGYPILVACVVLTAGLVFADQAEELLAAARQGDVVRLVALLDDGVDVDTEGPYGNTALIAAASNGRAEVIEVLLERGADPSLEESFYGAGAVEMALFNGHSELVATLLEAGAEGRETAFLFAMRSADLELARVAVESGPLLESTLAMLRANPMLGAKFKELLVQAESRPDPPAPDYTLAELERFTGRYEGWNSSEETVVTLESGSLRLSFEGSDPLPLQPSGEMAFRIGEDGREVRFSGRAGTIEAVAVGPVGAPPVPMRRSVATVVEGAAAKVRLSDAPVREATTNWPSFRGANADGIGDGRDVPTVWSMESGESVRWQSEVPGLGNSSPVVWGDRLFVTTALAEGMEQTIRIGLTGEGTAVDEAVEHSWRVVALDKTSGEVVWSTEVGRAEPETQRHVKSSQANSTPTTDGRYLVAIFPTAGLVCLNLQGEVLWRHDLGGLNAGAFSDPGIEWGFASSPVLYGDTVITQVDVHEGPYLAAWDLETGEEVWRVDRDVAPSWATPTLLQGAEGDELVVNGSTIHGYDPATGEELWSLGPNSELVIATPVAGKDVVYVSAGYPPIKPIYAVRAGTRGALEVEPGQSHDRLVWSQSPGGAYMPTPLLYRGLFYLLHHNGRIVAYDSATGDAVYKKRFSKGGVFTASPVAANGKLYLPTEEGHMYVLEAGPEYRELAINEFGEPLMATPAVSDGVLYVRTPTRIVAVGGEIEVEAEGGREPRGSSP
jgi:outer membrane protein assembly factor BamB